MRPDTRKGAPDRGRLSKTAATTQDLTAAYIEAADRAPGEQTRGPLFGDRNLILNPGEAFELIVVEFGDRARARRYVADLFMASRIEGTGR